MKEKWYKSSVTKAILVVSAHVLVIVMTASFMWLLSYPVLRAEIFAGKPAKEYKDSRNFIDKMLEYSQQAVSGIKSADLFETEGKYDPDKIVDIGKYYKTNTFDGENESGFAYRLGDLLEWAGLRYGNSYSDMNEESEKSMRLDENTEGIIVCKTADDTFEYYRVSDFYEAIKSGGLQFIVSQEETADMDNVMTWEASGEYVLPEGGFRGVQDEKGTIIYKDCWVYDGAVLTEQFAPIGAEDILAIVNKNPQWNGRLDEAYNMLDNVLYALNDQYVTYKKSRESMEEGDTNFSYIYADIKDRRVYTNKTEYRSYDALKDNIEKMKNSGKYIIVNPKLADFETDMEGVDASLWRDMVKNYGLGEEDFLFAAVVDTAYPVQDAFYTENALYNRYGGGVRRIAVLGCLAAVLLIIIVLWLTMVAGRSDKDEEIHLNTFDRWKTELAAAIVIVIWFVPTFLATANVDWRAAIQPDETVSYQQIPYVDDSVLFIIMACMLSVFTCCMFLTGFLSLVRRVKAKTLWKNSLIRCLYVLAKDIIKNLNCIWKTILIFGVFIVIHWGLIVSTMGVSYRLAFFLFFVDGAAFIYFVYKAIGRNKLKRAVKKISCGELGYEISLDKLTGDQREIAKDINSIGEGMEAAVAKSVKSERLKTDLITNVSHDIKTPLTSIINYVELLKQENFEDAKIRRYIEVLEQKSQRLKTLTEDVVEASKVSSGNITLEYMNLNLAEMIQQVSGEFEERFQLRNLKEVLLLPQEEVIIRADGRRMWRIFENIYNNAAKYAMEGTRIYAELAVEAENAKFCLKNISEQALNISADELTERFIRGDISRSTEGSGLGLSIAKTLTQMQGGTFELYLDGDLFKVTIEFPILFQSLK